MRREGFALRTIRIFFTKTGTSAYISHLDLQRVMARALRKSGFPAWYSLGFNPHIYMRFTLPLPLGQESVCESVDVKTESGEDVTVYLAALDSALPQGMNALAIAPPHLPADALTEAEYRLSCAEDAAFLHNACEAYNRQAQALVEHKTKRSQTTLDLKSLLPTLPVPNSRGEVVVRLPAKPEHTINPALLCGFLQGEGEAQGPPIDVLRLRILAGEQVFR